MHFMNLNKLIERSFSNCTLLKMFFVNVFRIRGVARLTLMVGQTFYNTTYLLLYLMACWFIRAFIYGCFKSAKYE